MEHLHSESDTGVFTEILLPWHKPEIECLVISLDTSNSFGSGEDGPNHTEFRV